MANLKTFSSSKDDDVWMNDTYYELADTAFLEKGNSLRFKFKNPLGNEKYEVIIETDMLTSIHLYIAVMVLPLVIYVMIF